MCGICGKLAFDRDAVVGAPLMKSMLWAIRHRGPDADGVYCSGSVGLGHQRLSIIDLSTGQQPLGNEDGSLWIIFNGEIYNYQELRQWLVTRNHIFKTKSDTEVILHLYEELGTDCVTKLRGMFAFAIWDDRNRELFIARDRVGIKPLYYHLSDKVLIFASEVKAILVDPDVQAQIEPSVLDRFLTFFYIPGDDTLFHNIRKLAPGCHMLVRDGKVKIQQYWNLEFSPSNIALSDAEERLVELLDESVRLHMIADVPVGFLLSGGVDSTAMLSFAVGKTEHHLSSYTLGFSESTVADERPYARAAANRYGAEHYEMTISADDFLAFLPQYIWHMEDPVCEPPAVALFYVSRLASEHVKVLISGEGGDEAFAGYPNYRSMLWLERLKSLCGPLKAPLKSLLTLVNRATRFAAIARYSPLLTVPFDAYYYSRTSSPFRLFNQRGSEVYASDFIRHVNKEYSLQPVRDLLQDTIGTGLLNRMLYVDTKTWLTDDLLLKADKMTMANSVELRVPLLDHRILEFAASLPAHYKVRRLTTKYILKKALSDKLPEEIICRKKAGFPVPYESWLRNELNDWVKDILLDPQSVQRGYFDRKGIERLISDDLQQGGYSKEIFSLAMLELWHRAFLDVSVASTSRGA
jgi:asparagine synthase (glutamine-hydrolysing)